MAGERSHRVSLGGMHLEDVKDANQLERLSDESRRADKLHGPALLSRHGLNFHQSAYPAAIGAGDLGEVQYDFSRRFDEQSIEHLTKFIHWLAQAKWPF